LRLWTNRTFLAGGEYVIKESGFIKLSFFESPKSVSHGSETFPIHRYTPKRVLQTHPAYHVLTLNSYEMQFPELFDYINSCAKIKKLFNFHKVFIELTGLNSITSEDFYFCA
jgi:hypothetical protein